MDKLFNKYKNLSRSLKASIWFLLCSVLQKGISVIFTPLFTRLMNTAEYGQFNVFYSWLNIITVFVTLNMYYGVYTQGLVKYEEDRKVFASSMQGLHLFLVLAWGTIYFIFHKFWNELFSLNTLQMSMMLVIIWASGVFSYWAAEQRVSLNYRYLVIITLIISLIKPIAGIIAVISFDDKVTARIITIAVVEFICFLWLFITQIKKGKALYSRQYWHHSLLFAIPLVPHYLSQSLLNSADRIMIERMIGAGEAGIYSLAYSIAFLMSMVNNALLQTIEPWIFKKIKNREIGDIKNVAYGALIFVAVANIFVIMFAPEIVTIFAPESYYNAIWVIPPVAASLFFQFAYSLFADFEFYFEQKSFITFATFVSALLNIILNYIFIKKYGYIAAGYTTLACYIAYAVGHYLFMNRTCNKFLTYYKDSVYETRKLIMITTGFLVAAGIILITYRNNVFRYVLIISLLLVLCLLRNRIRNVMNTFLAIRKL